MKIIHIISSLQKAGAETIMYNLCINDRKNEHFVISLSGTGYYKKFLKKKKIKTYIFNLKKKNLISQVIKIKNLVKKINPDAVQTWMYHADVIGGLIAKYCKKKVLWNLRNTNLNIFKSKFNTILIFITSVFLASFIPSRIISCSNKSLNYHRKIYLINKNKKIFEYIPNGYNFINITKIRKFRYQIRKKLKIKKNVFLIGLFARLDPQKNQKFIISLNKKLQKLNIKYKFILIGQGIKEIKKIHKNKKILYFEKKNNIIEYICALDLHVLPSLYGEAFPNIIAECMSMGVPCLATDVGDSKEIILNKDFLIDSKNVNQSVGKILKLYNIFKKNKNKWKRIQSRCKKKIKKQFTMPQMVKRYNDVWKKK